MLGCVCAKGEATLREEVPGEEIFELSFDDKQFMLYILKSPDPYGPSLHLQSVYTTKGEQVNQWDRREKILELLFVFHFT